MTAISPLSASGPASMPTVPAMPATGTGMPMDPLTQLRDLHLPEPIGWWPPAPGWWLSALLLLVSLSCALYYLWRVRRNSRYRRLAIAELEQYCLEFGRTEDSLQLLQQLSQLLRRAALVAFPRHQVAGLSGADWVRFLADSSDQPQFIQQQESLFSSALYQPDPQYDVDEIKQLCKRWLRKHKYSTWLKNRHSGSQSPSVIKDNTVQEAHHAQS